MIRRCEKQTHRGRCKRAEHTRGACSVDPIGTWCASCRDYRPHGDMQFCGNCGGRHARGKKPQQALQVHAKPLTPRQKRNLRKRRIVERARVLRRDGSL